MKALRLLPLALAFIMASAAACAPSLMQNKTAGVTVTAAPVFADPGDTNAIGYYILPEISIPDNPEIADKINNGEVMTNLKNAAWHNAESVIGMAAEDKEFSDMYAYSAYTALVDVSVSEASVMYGFRDYMYAGGVHPMHSVSYLTFSLETGELLTVSDIIDPGTEDAKKLLEDAVVRRLIEEDPWEWADDEYTNEQATAIAADFISGNYCDVWHLAPDSLVLTFSPYIIADYATGYVSVIIPYSEIPGVIIEKYIPSAGGGDAAVNMYRSDAAELEPFSVRYRDEDACAVSFDGKVSNMSITSQKYDYAVLFFADEIENAAVYLPDNDTYSVTWGMDGTEFTVFTEE